MSTASHDLPTQPRSRSLAWQGVLLLAVIELTVIASLIASYFYLRVGHQIWPPAEVSLPDLVRPTIALGLLVASTVPVAWMERRFRQGRITGLRWLLATGSLLASGYAALSVIGLSKLGYRWHSHAYGSISWTLSAYQLLHLVVLLGLGGYVFVLAAVGRLQHRKSSAVEVLALYWYFVALGSIGVWATLYVSPHVL